MGRNRERAVLEFPINIRREPLSKYLKALGWDIKYDDGSSIEATLHDPEKKGDNNLRIHLDAKKKKEVYRAKIHAEIWSYHKHKLLSGGSILSFLIGQKKEIYSGIDRLTKNDGPGES